MLNKILLTAAEGSTTFADIIPDTLKENFSTSNAGSLPMLLLTLGCAFVTGLFIYYLYKRTFSGVLYSRNFNISLVLITMVTALIIRCITSNLALSLGMVGALSIVRFRTAVKEVMDTVYMFWAVAVGITMGAGFFLMGIVGTAVIGVLLYVLYMIKNKGTYAYLLVIRHDFDCSGEISYAVRKLPRGTRLKSRTVTRNGVEVTLELRLPGGYDDSAIINDILKIEGVTDASLISYQGDYGA